MTSDNWSPVKHLGAGSLQFLQNLRELGVIVAGRTPAQNPGKVIPGPQRKNAELTLKHRYTQSAASTAGGRARVNLQARTCLCSVSISISDSTQPTLPSPPHTRILKVSNFWNSRRLPHTQRCELACQTYCVLLCFCLCASVCVSPQVRPSIHQVKHLRRVQQLLEAPQELHTLIVSTFRVNKDQQRTGAGRRTRRLPETCAHNTHTHQLLVCRGLVGHWFVSTSCRPTWAVLALMLHTLKPL